MGNVSTNVEKYIGNAQGQAKGWRNWGDGLFGQIHNANTMLGGMKDGWVIKVIKVKMKRK